MVVEEDTRAITICSLCMHAHDPTLDCILPWRWWPSGAPSCGFCGADHSDRNVPKCADLLRAQMLERVAYTGFVHRIEPETVTSQTNSLN